MLLVETCPSTTSLPRPFFTLDLAGNRLGYDHNSADNAKDETITYTVNARDQVMAEDSTINANDKSYAYDPNGSTLTITTGSAVTTYTWDIRNRMTAVDAPGTANDATYTYDENGIRTSKIVNGAATYFLNDTANPTGYTKPIQESTTLAGNPTLTYTLGLTVEAQTTAGGVTTYLIRDGHGYARALANAAGTVTQTADFDAFGNMIGTGTFDTTWFGCDGYFDRETGQYYNLARYRKDFRFMSWDSYEASSADPMALHKYLYTPANPISYNDPTGNMFGFAEQLIVGGIRAILQAEDGVVSALAHVQAWWTLHPLIANATALGISAWTLYSFATDEEFRAFVYAQPNPLGFIQGEVNALYSSARNLTSMARGAASALNDLAAVRRILQKPGGLGINRTLAFGTLEADGMGMTRIANSGPSVPGATIPEIQEPRYAASRVQDAEQKLYEYFRQYLRPDSTGTLTIAVDHPLGPCSSCQSVKAQFTKDFPGIRVVVQYLTPAPIPWSGQ